METIASKNPAANGSDRASAWTGNTALNHRSVAQTCTPNSRRRKIDDIASPQFVRLVPTSQLGGFLPYYTFAVGNLLVLMTSIDPGFATLDISDPDDPVLRQWM